MELNIFSQHALKVIQKPKIKLVCKPRTAGKVDFIIHNLLTTIPKMRFITLSRRANNLIMLDRKG